MQKVIDSIGDNLLVKFYKVFCSCFFDASSLWEFYRAPEPSDINWQNMGVGAFRRTIQTGFVWVITVIILILCAVIINAIKNAEDRIKKEADGAKFLNAD